MFKQMVQSLNFSAPDPIYGIGINFKFSSKSGSKSDLDNLSGLVMDCLVESKVIPDDNWGVIPRLTCQAIKAPDSSITVYMAENKQEYMYVIDKFLT